MRFLRRLMPKPNPRAVPLVDFWVASTVHAYGPSFPITDRDVLAAALPGVAAFWLTFGELFPEKVVPLMRHGWEYEDSEIERLLDPAPLDEAYPDPGELESLETLAQRWVVPTLVWIAVLRHGRDSLGLATGNAIAETVLEEGLEEVDLLRIFRDLALQGARIGHAKPSIARQLIWDYVGLQERNAVLLNPGFRDSVPSRIIEVVKQRALTLQDYERDVAEMISAYEDTFGPVEAPQYEG